MDPLLSKTVKKCISLLHIAQKKWLPNWNSENKSETNKRKKGKFYASC